MSPADDIRWMLKQVALALGGSNLERMAFVGGCTTGLLLTRPGGLNEVRATYDVDLIVSLMGSLGWYTFQAELAELGFTPDIESGITCRYRLGAITVDFMPDDASILGFTNRWYAAALQSATWYQLDPETRIRILTPVYFLATKFEAFWGRGAHDVLSSKDLEDILLLLDARDALFEEISNDSQEMRDYLSNEFQKLVKHPEFDYALQGNLHLESRIKRVINMIQSLIKQWPSY